MSWKGEVMGGVEIKPNPYLDPNKVHIPNKVLSSLMTEGLASLCRQTGVSPRPVSPTGKNRRKEKAQIQRRTKNKAAAASRKKNRR